MVGTSPDGLIQKLTTVEYFGKEWVIYNPIQYLGEDYYVLQRQNEGMVLVSTDYIQIDEGDMRDEGFRFASELSSHLCDWEFCLSDHLKVHDYIFCIPMKTGYRVITVR